MANTAPMNATPFFGSKISLISKSEIRYEGILYTVDPKESTIALAQVRSFGSEDRQVEKPVPPRDEVFQYIIFRASDIKDLIVDQPPSPALSDPAIIQAHSTTSNSVPSSFPQPSSINAGQSSTSIQQQLQAGIQNAAAIAAAVSMPKSSVGQQQPASGTGVQQNVQDSNKANKSSASIAQVVASGGQHKPQQANKQQQQQQQQLPQRNHMNQMNRQQHSNNQQNNNRNQHHDGTSGGGGGGANTGSFVGNRNNFNRRLNTVTRSPMNGGFNQQRHVSNFSNRNFANRFQQRQPTGFYNYNNRQSNRNFVSRPNQKPSISLPDSDFDFEKAQDEFKQLEEKLTNLKVNGDSTPVVAPDVTTNNEQQPSQSATDVDATKDPCYNKEKSFFDQISCESLERERGNVQRVDWKLERKLNRETFGVVAPMRRNNGFRPNNRYSSGGNNGTRFRTFQNYRSRTNNGNPNNSNQNGGSSNKPSNGLPNSNSVSSSSGPTTLTTASVVAATSTNIIISPAKN